MKVKNERSKVLHLGRSNPMHQYMLVAPWVKSSFTEKSPWELCWASE